MDARIKYVLDQGMLNNEVDQFVSVYAELGINEGDAHIIRNAGGSA